jgi:5-methylcytosine-specific restriction endonuclease McrA
MTEELKIESYLGGLGREKGIRTQDQINADQETLIKLMPYIISLKEKELGGIKCELCGKEEQLEIHHKKYGDNVNYYDLELLCIKCHRGKYHSKKTKEMDFYKCEYKKVGYDRRS